jgi:hypothetical protein
MLVMYAVPRRSLIAATLAVAFADGVKSAFAQTAGRQASAQRLSLIVYERAGCPWCLRWDKEIAPIYPRTDTGMRVPLRRISLDYPKADAPKLEDPVRFTPTFVLMLNGREFGRITGYHDDGFFWGLLEALVARADKEAAASNNLTGIKV